MNRLLSSVIGCMLICSLISNGHAQQPSVLSKAGASAKEKVEQLKPGAHISIVLLYAPEEFGNFVSAAQDDFTFYDVDQKANVVIRYEDVKKIKNGYGGYNSVRQSHTDPSKRLIGVLAGIAIIGTVIGIAAASQ